jgi:hypothetical protein
MGLKYCLPGLVTSAENYLATEFTFESVFPILIEADRVGAENIRESAICFIFHHWGLLAR